MDERQPGCVLGGGLSFLSHGQAAPDSHEKEGRAFSQSRALHGREEDSHSQSVPSTEEGLQDSQQASRREYLVFFNY